MSPRKWIAPPPSWLPSCATCSESSVRGAWPIPLWCPPDLALVHASADELRHRSDARVLLPLHRYLVSTVYPDLDVADPALQNEYNATVTDEDGNVWCRPTRLLFFLGRDPYFVTTERMKLQV